jgi:hypothetical protein
MSAVISKKSEYHFPEEVWEMIKVYAGILGLDISWRLVVSKSRIPISLFPCYGKPPSKVKKILKQFDNCKNAADVRKLMNPALKLSGKKYERVLMEWAFDWLIDDAHLFYLLTRLRVLGKIHGIKEFSDENLTFYLNQRKQESLTRAGM